MRVRILCVAFVLLAWSQLGLAAEVESQKLGPQALVQQVANQTLERIKRDSVEIDKNPAHIHALIDELLMPHFDFQRMSRWVLGKHWRKTNAEQKIAFVMQFKSLLVRTYATSLKEYSDEKIHYLPFRGSLASGDVTVRSEILQPGGFPIPINYRLYLKGDKWMVYDIAIDGISLISNYRSSFSRQIRRGGIDKLIQKLADKNKK